jgi:hypothetical protein
MYKPGTSPSPTVDCLNANADFVMRVDDVHLIGSDLVFADDFESGDTSEWSTVID